MHAPTSEQQHALDLFATGESLAIEAGAGTGKTSTLIMLANSTSRRGQYIAFNKSIVAEAGTKMPGTVNASTTHSLAYRAVGHEFGDRLRHSKRMKSIDIANRLGIEACNVVTYADERKQLGPSFLAGLAMTAIIRFCQSADEAPTAKHVPYIEGLDPAGTGRGPINKAVAQHLAPSLVKAWADFMKPTGDLPYRHDHYLKAWQLSDPKIGADYILFDEAQDANPVMVAIVAAQSHAQLVWVGDSQQQIYTFTGAVNALANVPAENRAFLTQSFRFGPAIAEVANVALSRLDAELRVVGTDSIASMVVPVAEPEAILARTNATAVRTLLLEQNAGRKVHLVGGGKEIVKFAKAAAVLMAGGRTEHPELACFDSWNEVREYVEQDEQGGDLRLMVKLVEEFGVETILAALDSDVREEDADVVISTAHKAKGREWNTVQLAGDFPADPQDEELRLLYVAVTRAKRELDITAAPLFAEGFTSTVRPIVATVAAPVAPVVPPVASPVTREAKTASESTHVGSVGESLSLELGVTWVRDEPTQYGSYMHKLIDLDGNEFKAFLDEKLMIGSIYDASWTIKGHEEFRGVKVTTVARPVGLQVAS